MNGDDQTPRGPENTPPPAPETPAPYRMSPVPPTERVTGAPQLRAMRVGELLDAAIKLYREHWRTFMGLVAFVVVPFTFVEQYSAWSVSQNAVDGDSSFMVVVLLGAISFLVVQPFLTAAILRAASGTYLNEKVSIGDAYSFALPKMLSILLVTILTALAVLGGFILLILPGIFFYIRFLFGPSALVMEGKRGTKAMGRSWGLAKGYFWKLFGTVLLTSILTGIVSMVLTIPANVIAFNLDEGGWFIIAIGASLAQIIVAPVMAIVVVLLYFDMRIRKEGYDLTLMARELSTQPGVE